MMRLIPVIAIGSLLLLGACSPSEETQSGDDLRSDIPLRSIQYLSEHPEDAAEVKVMCEEWKASQRPLASWPAVVTQNCTNVDAANLRNLQRQQRENMKRQMGI